MTYPLHVLHTRSCAPGAVLEGRGRPVTINVPSRYIPVLGVVLASVTIFGSVGLNLYHGHDIGGIPWPYISDTVRHSLPLPPSPSLSLSLSLSPSSLARSLARARARTHTARSRARARAHTHTEILKSTLYSSCILEMYQATAF